MAIGCVAELISDLLPGRWLGLAAGGSNIRNHFLLKRSAIFIGYLKQSDAVLPVFRDGMSNVEFRERRDKLPSAFIHLPDFELLKASHVPSEKG